jgi:hypothetical protein
MIMATYLRHRRALCGALETASLLVAALLVAAVVNAGERQGRTQKGKPQAPAPQNVEMFDAIANGQIKVRLIPKDSSESRVIIENKTDKPLSIKLPDAFAGVPVLAQAAPGAPGAGAGAGAQPFGGGMGGMGGGGGFFNVPPERLVQFQVTTVCLEHGKAEPRAAIPYEIKPIEAYTDKVPVHELCRLLGSGQVSQRAAQAAAWHLNNNMSWEQLAAKQVHFATGPSRPYFTTQEIQAAMRIAATAVALAELHKKQTTETSSLSQQ